MLIDKMKAAGAPVVEGKLSGGSYVCESLAYYIAHAKSRGFLESGFFMHVPAVQYNPATENIKVEAMAKGLLDYYGPNADPDGDGIPNLNDPEPFKFKFPPKKIP
jgi:hypothetical protein